MHDVQELLAQLRRLWLTLLGKEENNMPLTNTTQFIQDLVANDKQNFATVAEAATAFAKAFSSYFGNVSVPPLISPPPPLPASNLDPLAVSKLTAGLVTAFSAKDPASVCLGIQLAVLAYMNPPTLMFGPAASAAASPSPLAGFIIPAMSVLQEKSLPAKTILATQISLWLQTTTVTMGTAVTVLV